MKRFKLVNNEGGWTFTYEAEERLTAKQKFYLGLAVAACVAFCYAVAKTGILALVFAVIIPIMLALAKGMTE